VSNHFGLGWLPQLPDIRDYTVDHPTVASLLSKTTLPVKLNTTLPMKADLRPWCSPIENQGTIGSCTAHAAVGLVEYYERKAFGRFVDASRLFVYKVTRKLLGWTGDTGAYLRTAMQALVMFGAPPEQFWRYDVAKYEDEPTPFLYALADNYKTTKYFRLDPIGQTREATLDQIRSFCAAGQPSMFGFSVYQSLYSAQGGMIPFPTATDTLAGGHAVMCVGYDDALQIGTCTGALMIRNSWGTGWGQNGYGWLPYEYVRTGLATDFWAIQSQGWVDTRAFA
jgi:C1A family cysteine protease